MYAYLNWNWRRIASAIELDEVTSFYSSQFSHYYIFIFQRNLLTFVTTRNSRNCFSNWFNSMLIHIVWIAFHMFVHKKLAKWNIEFVLFCIKYFISTSITLFILMTIIISKNKYLKTQVRCVGHWNSKHNSFQNIYFIIIFFAIHTLYN